MTDTAVQFTPPYTTRHDSPMRETAHYPYLVLMQNALHWANVDSPVFSHVESFH